MSDVTSIQIEAVARAICAARGIDPDAPKRVPQRYFDCPDDRLLEGVSEPQWQHFKPDAREFILCHDAVIRAGAPGSIITPRVAPAR